MVRFFSDMAKAVASLFAPAGVSGLVAVGYQPITDDIYRCSGSACYASDLDGLDLSRK